MKKRRTVLILALAVTVLAAWGWYTYRETVLSRPEAYTTFQPFSGKLFQLDPEKIDHIDIFNKNTEAKPTSYIVDPLRYETEEDVKQISDFLNSFRYHFWMPGPKGVDAIKMITPTGSIRIYPKGIKPAYYKYKMMHCMIRDNKMWVNGIWYFGSEEFFQKFDELQQP